MRVVRRITQRCLGALLVSEVANFLHQPSRLATGPSNVIWQQKRFAMQGSVGPGAGRTGGAAPTPPSRMKALPTGCIIVTAKNIASEVRTADVPVMLYFHVEVHPDVLHYTATLMHQIELANKQSQCVTPVTDAPPLASAEKPKLAIKLALVNIQEDAALAKQFGVSEHMFPLVYFVLNGEAVDRLHGLAPEAQVKDAIDAFIKFAKEEKEKAKEQQQEPQQKPSRMDNDEENVMTLLQAAAGKLRDGDFLKAEKLFRKGHKLAEEGVAEARKRLGLHIKKMTPEVAELLKKDPHHNACPQSLAGLALTLTAKKLQQEALAVCKEIREKYPWSMWDLKEVRDAVCRIEIIGVSKYEGDKDSYVNLMRNDDVLNDSAKFYNNNVKLAVAHYLETHVDLAIDELLRLIRAEPKMLDDLKRAGIVDAAVNLSGGHQAATPARRVLFLMFESLGNKNEMVLRARKKMAAFMHT